MHAQRCLLVVGNGTELLLGVPPAPWPALLPMPLSPCNAPMAQNGGYCFRCNLAAFAGRPCCSQDSVKCINLSRFFSACVRPPRSRRRARFASQRALAARGAAGCEAAVKVRDKST